MFVCWRSERPPAGRLAERGLGLAHHSRRVQFPRGAFKAFEARVRSSLLGLLMPSWSPSGQHANVCSCRRTRSVTTLRRIRQPTVRIISAPALQRQRLAFAMEANAYPLTDEEDLTGEHGEVFTRRWVVDLILDLVGYTSDRDLAAGVALEPACGSGAFLVPMVERLVASARTHRRSLEEAADAIVAFDLLQGHVDSSRSAVERTLAAAGVAEGAAREFAAHWVERRDFLLQPPADGSVDVVVGNPPYIRLEALPEGSLGRVPTVVRNDGRSRRRLCRVLRARPARTS